MITMPVLLWIFFLVHIVGSYAGLLSRQWFRTIHKPDYYSQFDLDYDCEDAIRPAGKTHGVLNQAGYSDLREDNLFFKWFARSLERGMENSPIRHKPFYAVDIGTCKDRGEKNPTIMIMNEHLHINEQGEILPSSGNVSFETREIWQPWLKPRCNFAVRYIIPNRANIMKIMKSNGQLQIWIERSKTQKQGLFSRDNEVTAKFSVRPLDWFSRYFRRKNVEMQVPVNLNALLINRKEL